MREVYQIFLDSREGLLTGALQLDHNGTEATGQMELYGHPLPLSGVRFEGNKRSFQGVLRLEDREVDFRAEGELEDEVLDVMIRTAGNQMLVTGFLQSEE